MRCSEIHTHTKTLRNETPQNLYLHFPHDLGMNFALLLLPYNMQLRNLFFKLIQILQHLVHVTAVR